MALNKDVKMAKPKLTKAQKRWVDALRSGKYKQGKGRLTHAGRFCCLGVACVVTQETIDKEWKHEKDLSEAAHNVIAELNLNDGDGYLTKLDLFDGHAFSLAQMNDSGMSFLEIADFIESNPYKVFNQDPDDDN